jgi:hypothetical protein
MLQIPIIVGIVISSLLISTWQFEADKNPGLPKIPYVPNVIGLASSSFAGSSGSSNSESSGSSSNQQSSLQTNLQTPDKPTKSNSAIFTTITPVSKQSLYAQPLYSLVSGETNTINSQLSSIALCGEEQQVFSYDKTDMKTGGDIHFFVAHPPSETLTIKFSDGSTKASLENHNINGCFVAYNLPNNIEVNLNLSGDYNGTMKIITGLPTETTITCTPTWSQSIQYDNFGNVIQKFDPPITHRASCALS